ncbi:hypothetical protein ACIPY2_05190 [Paenarthrobacter sp. NPDC089675]|uniref:hypothetical protein n=1 Tax=Paenarthrobacter sp. NPDC089675 TaxID=3364376 RepID=UPI0037FEF1DF
MTLLAERLTKTESTLGTATDTAVTAPAPRGGNYVTLPAGVARTLGEGSYVTVHGSPTTLPGSRGSYVTVNGTPAVTVGGSYVTLSTAD